MKSTNRRSRKKGLAQYKTTLILLTIFLAMMGLVAFMPLKRDKPADNGNMANFSK